jgi:environmental stress-induced protein Ves
MRFRKITPANWISKPWKNGGGSTIQLVIFPEKASLEKEDFLLRVSIASTTQSGSFSQFPGYDRVLASLETESLLLKHADRDEKDREERLEFLKPYRFSGDEKTDCELKGPLARDLNAMIKSDQGSLEMHLLELPAYAKRKVSAADFTVLFCVRGDGRFAFPGEGRHPIVHESFEKDVTVAIETDSPSRKFDIEVGAQGAQFLITDFLTHLG